MLSISKYETEYTYAGSLALAIALALVWERQWLVAVPVALLTLILVAHGLTIQQQMYRTGICQPRALETLKAVLTDTAPRRPTGGSRPGRHPVVGRTSCGSRQFLTLRGKFVKVSVTHDPQEARMVFHTDCSLSIKVRVVTKQSLKA